MDIKEIIEDFKQSIYLNEGFEECYLVSPIFFRYESDSIRIRFFEENGFLYIADCGSVKEHIDNRYLDIRDYHEKVEKIKKRFFIFENDRSEFVMQFPSDCITSIEMFMGFYFQAIALLANIDI